MFGVPLTSLGSGIGGSRVSPKCTFHRCVLLRLCGSSRDRVSANERPFVFLLPDGLPNNLNEYVCIERLEKQSLIPRSFCGGLDCRTRVCSQNQDRRLHSESPEIVGNGESIHHMRFSSMMNRERGHDAFLNLASPSCPSDASVA